VGSSERFFKQIYADGSYFLVRCDRINDDKKCYAKYYHADYQTDKCEEFWEYNVYSTRVPYDWRSFSYDEVHYPTQVSCLDGSQGCQKYCEDTTEKECVTLDANRFVVQRDGMNFTFHDASFSMDVFLDDQCDDPASPLPAPHNLCETLTEINPVIPPCAYHVNIANDFGLSGEYFGVHLFSSYWQNYYSKKVISDSSYTLVRCDHKDKDGYCYMKQKTSDTCQDDTTSGGEDPEWPGPFKYDSAGGFPKDVQCPDDTPGCKKYCDDVSEYNCIIVDTEGHFVYYSRSTYTYYDEPAMSVFEDDKCEGEDPHLPAPSSFCESKEIINPKFADCSFHIILEGSIRRSDEDNIHIYGILVNGKLLALKATKGEYYTVYRCDTTNEKGECYMRNYEPGEPCDEEYEPQEDAMDLMEILPQPFWYDSSKYPVDAQCPDGTDGCKKYCIIPGTCILVDSVGHFVQTLEGTQLNNWTYIDSPPMEVFEVDTCSGVHIPAPTDPCSTPTQPSSTAQPSTTPQPSTGPVSSASFIQSVFGFVAIAVILALL